VGGPGITIGALDGKTDWRKGGRGNNAPLSHVRQAVAAASEAQPTTNIVMYVSRAWNNVSGQQRRITDKDFREARQHCSLHAMVLQSAAQYHVSTLPITSLDASASPAVRRRQQITVDRLLPAIVATA